MDGGGNCTGGGLASVDCVLLAELFSEFPVVVCVGAKVSKESSESGSESTGFDESGAAV